MYIVDDTFQFACFLYGTNDGSVFEEWLTKVAVI